MAQHSAEIAIAGGGVIGLSIALTLAAEGREVVVFDPNEPGSGASYGNAGTVANYAVLPLGTPAVLRNLPALLFDSGSPLSIRLAAVPALAPWLLRFARQSLPAAMKRNAVAIAALLAEAMPAWDALAVAAGATDLFRRRGVLYAYDGKAAFEQARWEIELRRALGVAQEQLTADELAALEPGLPHFAGGALFFPQAVNFSDPGTMMGRLAAAAAAQGVQFVRARVDGFARERGGVAIEAGKERWKATRLVIAAGAHSRPLAVMAGDRVPLDTERGYHVEFDMVEPPVTRPVCPTSRGFYLVPMAGRLRVAGTVELGGLAAPANPRRLALLENGARSYFPGLGKPSRTWLGFRPSMPDSVPVIGPSGGGDEVILAFGHGHLGLTLAPVTARMVSALVAGRQPTLPPAPYSPRRFA